jgi:hypothetical protein
MSPLKIGEGGSGGFAGQTEGGSPVGEGGGNEPVLTGSVVVLDEEESAPEGGLDPYRRSVPGHVKAGHSSRFGADRDFSGRILARRPAVGVDREREANCREGADDEVLAEGRTAGVMRTTGRRGDKQRP